MAAKPDEVVANENVSSPILSVFAVCLLVVSVETVSRLISLTGGRWKAGREEREKGTRSTNASQPVIFFSKRRSPAAILSSFRYAL